MLLMRREFGKWLMDIAKYIVTAVVLSSFFGEASTWVVYLGGGLSMLVALFCGLYLVSDEPLKITKNNTKK